jgi:hypothetical protein
VVYFLLGIEKDLKGGCEGYRKKIETEKLEGSHMATGIFAAGLNVIPGLDFICASLALAYISRLLFQQISAHDSVGALYSAVKVSLRDQHVVPRKW